MKVIAFEGIDGSGKTTQAALLHQYLQQNSSLPVSMYSCCSKNNFWGAVIKKVYRLDSNSSLKCLGKLRSIQEILYALCARSNTKKISNSPDSLVIADRSIITAYASHYKKLPEWFVSLLEPRVIPSLVFFLDIEPSVAISRIASREGKFHDEHLESLVEFRGTYFNYIMGDRRPACLAGTKFMVIDGNKPVGQVHQEIRASLDDYIQNNGRGIQNGAKSECVYRMGQA
ncbi:MAG: hypothetical protein QXM31_03370 [Candidatus Woesearchaeota archaeon]